MARLEIFGLDGRRDIVELDGVPITFGRAPTVDCVISDESVSRVHARIVPLPPNRWAIEDLGSMNGTWVSGERVYGQHVLQNGAEIRLGGASMLFHDAGAVDGSSTVKKARPPVVTQGEHRVLVELCRPLFGPSVVRRASTTREIAEAIFTGEANVKQHLGHLYDKLAIPEDRANRRDLLATAAVECGLIGRGDYA
ncbi:MAG TPA: FHA domain-containing protein [Acidimicrobiales bacterium]|jgi:hypothetical protein